MVSNCEFVTFPLVSWVRCGTNFVSIPDCNCSMFCQCFSLGPFYFCIHLGGEEGVGCSAQFVFLVSGDCCMVLPRGSMGLSATCDLVFPGHTHLSFFWLFL